MVTAAMAAAVGQAAAVGIWGARTVAVVMAAAVAVASEVATPAEVWEVRAERVMPEEVAATAKAGLLRTSP